MSADQQVSAKALAAELHELWQHLMRGSTRHLYALIAELDLSAFEGVVPVEILGYTEFPRVGRLPYFLTLGPYGFYWFELRKPG